jgi:hypothetical protein
MSLSATTSEVYSRKSIQRRSLRGSKNASSGRDPDGSGGMSAV